MRAGVRALAAMLACLLTGAVGAQSTVRPDLARDLERLATGEHIAGLPPADSVTTGPRLIAAGSVVHGSVVALGPVEVRGRVEGSAVSLAGDVIVRQGGVVTGDAVSVGGRASTDGGTVGGELRSMVALPSPVGGTLVTDARTPAQRTMEAVRGVGVVFGVLLFIALGVFLFAGTNLDQVVGAIEHQVALAFWVGILGQVLLLPALLVLIVALALSLIGILLIPFAIVAYVIACAGLVTLGFLAVARLVGGAFWRGAESTVRGRSLLALGAGIAIFFALWMVAALLAWTPLAASTVRAAAFVATWAAMTVGLGAALKSRAGTHRRVAGMIRPVELAAWQTPTPVAGVVAARRPTAAAREARQ